MKKIDIRPHTVTVVRTDGTKEEVPYQIKESLVEILFNRELKLNGVGVIKQNQLAEKILASGLDELLLEDEEYERITRALSLVEGLGKNDVEFAKRVINATQV